MSIPVPEVTSISEEGWNVFDEKSEVVIPTGSRVYRIYRSIDRVHWAECDPALTERAACNYADYIKKSNPNEFVRCEDPNGIILFYE